MKEAKVAHYSRRFTELKEPGNENDSNKQSMEKGCKKKNGNTSGFTKKSAIDYS